jgi:hypothetical protein
MMCRGMHRWYSLCSRHRAYDPDCETCKAGEWQFIPKMWLDSLVFYTIKPLWSWWHNRPNSRSKRFLRKHFPNLR